MLTILSIDYLASQEVNIETKYKFIYDIALGMYHLHKEGVIHRDLAARNILLSKHLDAKVADFGMSRQAEEEGSPGVTQTTVGPLKWMAPEAIEQRQYSKATDSFSFGVVIWEIITLQEPWAELNTVEAAILIVTQNARLPLPETSEWLKSLMELCWKKNPEERPTFENMCELIARESGITNDFDKRCRNQTPQTSTSSNDRKKNSNTSSSGIVRSPQNSASSTDLYAVCDIQYQPVDMTDRSNNKQK